MSDIATPDLFSKVGPLPAWAWGAVAVGGFIVVQHLRGQSATPAVLDTTADTPTTDTTADTPTTDTTGTYDTSLGTGGDGITIPLSSSDAGYDYGAVNSGSYSGTVAGSTFTSNQQWAVYAIEQMLSAGAPAADTTTAITLYLAGQPLTPQEGSLVNQAITLVGPPPLPQPLNIVPPAIVVTPKPVGGVAPPNPKLPKGYGWAHPLKGDTAAKMEARYHLTPAMFAAFNPGLSNRPLSVTEWVRVKAEVGPHP